MNNNLCRVILAAPLVLATVPAVNSQPNDYDFDFVKITHTDNPAYLRQGAGPVNMGRGSVGYKYRIAKTEISTSQWMEYANSLAERGDVWALGPDPFFWGARLNQTNFRWELRTDIPDAGNVFVGGLKFADAAMYCNWLHNGKQNDDASLITGAYDLLTIGRGNPQIENTTHLPGAKYWVPTLDEWMKAVYWDPDKPDEGGWWMYPNRSDGIPVAGPPGVGETNTGYLDTRDDWYEFRIGEYPETLTPWGLLDATGGTQELTESILGFGFDDVLTKGGSLGDRGFGLDSASQWRSVSPNGGPSQVGFRIASSVPAPGALPAMLLSAVIILRRKR